MKKFLITFIVILVIAGAVVAYLFIPYNKLTIEEVIGDVETIEGIGFMVSETKAIVLDDREDIERIYNDIKNQEFKKVYTTQEQPQNRGNPLLIIRFTEESEKWDINIYHQFNRFPGYNLLKLNRFVNDFFVAAEQVAFDAIIDKYVKELVGGDDEMLAYFDFSLNDFITTMRQNKQYVSNYITSTNSPLNTDLNRIDFGNGNILSVYEYENNAAMEEDALLVNIDGSIKGGKYPSDTSHFFKRGKIMVNYIGNDQEMLDILTLILSDEFASPMIAAAENGENIEESSSSSQG